MSLTPNLTEIMFALEAGPQVVAVTKNDHYPPEVERLPEIGDLHLDYEALVALKPDLVVYDPALNAAQVQQLKRLGLPVTPFPTQTLEQMLQSIESLGQKLGREEAARELLQGIQAGLQRAEARQRSWQRHPSVLVEIWHTPLVAAGEGGYVDELIGRAGLDNALAGRPGYPTVSLEELHRLDPEVLVLTQPVLQELKRQPAWARLRAVEGDQVLVIAEDLLVRPGPRLVQALEQIQDWVEARRLHLQSALPLCPA